MVWCSWVVNLFMGSSWGSTHEMLKFSWVLLMQMPLNFMDTLMGN